LGHHGEELSIVALHAWAKSSFQLATIDVEQLLTATRSIPTKVTDRIGFGAVGIYLRVDAIRDQHVHHTPRAVVDDVFVIIEIVSQAIADLFSEFE
jgi:hypothetical protein